MNSAYAIMDVIFNSFWSWIGFFGPITMWTIVWSVTRIRQAEIRAKTKTSILDPSVN